MIIDLKTIIDFVYLLFLLSALGGGFYVYYMFVSSFKEDENKKYDIFYNPVQKRQIEDILNGIEEMKADLEEIKKRYHEKEQN